MSHLNSTQRPDFTFARGQLAHAGRLLKPAWWCHAGKQASRQEPLETSRPRECFEAAPAAPIDPQHAVGDLYNPANIMGMLSVQIQSGQVVGPAISPSALCLAPSLDAGLLHEGSFMQQ